MGSRDLSLWVAIGIGAGLGVGLLDGLLALADEPSRVDAWQALALAVVSLAVVGAVAAPAAAALASAENVRLRTPLAGSVPLLLGGVLGVLGFGFTTLLAIERTMPGLGSVAKPVVVWVATAGALALVARFARPLARRSGGPLRLLALGAALAAVSALAARLADRDASALHAAPVYARAFGPQLAPPSVLFVVLDTVRADRLSLYGHPLPTSPALDAFAREATVFERAISPAPWTVPAHATLFTGLAPSSHGASNEQRLLRSDLDTLAELLRERGFATAAISCNANVSRGLGFEQGFDVFHEVFREARGERAIDRTLAGRVLGRTRGDKGAARAVSLASAWLEARATDEQPFFLFVNLLEAHLPYDPPRAQRERFADGPSRPLLAGLSGAGWSGAAYRRIGRRDLSSADVAQLARLYDAEIAYQDAQLGALLETLRASGRLDATLVVIVSDHGENLGEHGGLVDHVFSIHQTLLQVPLVVRLPGRFPAGLRYPHVVSTGSLFATILAETGCAPAAGSVAYPPLPRSSDAQPPAFVTADYELPVLHLASFAQEVPGVDLRPFAVRSRAILRGDWKLVRRSPGGASLFDLSRDPFETRPLDPDLHREGRELERSLEAWHASLPVVTTHDVAAAGPDAVTRASLRALGYSD